jgi:hypothetical protein
VELLWQTKAAPLLLSRDGVMIGSGASDAVRCGAIAIDRDRDQSDDFMPMQSRHCERSEAILAPYGFWVAASP